MQEIGAYFETGSLLNFQGLKYYAYQRLQIVPHFRNFVLLKKQSNEIQQMLDAISTLH